MKIYALVVAFRKYESQRKIKKLYLLSGGVCLYNHGQCSTNSPRRTSVAPEVAVVIFYELYLKQRKYLLAAWLRLVSVISDSLCRFSEFYAFLLHQPGQKRLFAVP